ncbi:hypothetical protein AA103587_1574 [Gluconobacter kanchanaburiensis NBRC 103587]|nr:hypothetical protein AA103587_1574 [Gluconobacter kanchanaburiensis NBRC 103587]
MRLALLAVLFWTAMLSRADAKGINTFVAPDMHYHPPPPGPLPRRCPDGTIVIPRRRCHIKSPVRGGQGQAMRWIA